MRLERSKNLVHNLKWGVLYRCSGMLIPFVCKAAIIRIFGVHYLGLNNLFASVLSTLNLAELGFSSAVVFFMYKEIAEDNTKQICALLNYFKRVYQIVGMVVLTLGLALIPFLPYLIKKDVPADINIYVIYVLTLAATVLSYFLFAYKNSIITAFQKESVLYKIRAAVLLTESFAQIFAIFVLQNYYSYIAITILATAANNIIADQYVRKNYPEYQPRGMLTRVERKAIGEKIKGLLYYKIGGVMVTSTSSILISAFLGLKISGIYGNYYYILTLLFGLLAVYYSSFRAGLGNSYITETREKNFETFKQLQFLQSWGIGFCAISLLSLYQDFIAFYAGEENILDWGIAFCLSLYLYCWKIQDVVHVFKEGFGYWTKDRFRPFVGAILNLTFSVISVQFIGLYGIVLALVLQAVTIDLLWAPKALFREYFRKSRMVYYRILLGCVLDLLVMGIPTVFIVSFIKTDSYLLNFMIKAVICLVVPNAMFILKNHRKPEFAAVKYRVKKLLR